MTIEDIDLIENAAAIIDGEALCLRMSSTLGPDNNDWSGEDDAKETCDEWKRIATQLYDLAERMGK